jgi:hypothetical protein
LRIEDALLKSSILNPVTPSTFRLIPSSFARLTALLRNSVEKSACVNFRRSVTGVARYSSRAAKAG